MKSLDKALKTELRSRFDGAAKGKSTSSSYKPPQIPSYRVSNKTFGRVNVNVCETAKVASNVYTGSLVKGIGMMHKSNFVPVVDEEHAKHIAGMRR